MAYGLAGLGAVVLGLTVAGLLTAARADWRFVDFIPFQTPVRTALLFVGGVGLFVAAAWVGLANRAAARASVGVGAVLGAMVVCAGGVATAGHQAAGRAEGSWRSVQATSPDGRFQLVATAINGQGIAWYRLRTTGWPRREGKAVVACVRYGDDRTERVRGARFVDGERVAFTLDDGQTWTAGFDGGSLRPDRFLNRCGWD